MSRIGGTSEQTGRRGRVLRRAACVALATGCTVTLLPATAAAAPAAPVLPQAIVGLSQGSQGADVTTVQQALINAGIPVPGGADGIFGPATRAALESYQSSKGLAVTGQVDTATATALGLVAAPATPAPATTPDGYVGLAEGAEGPLVTDLQKALARFGVYMASAKPGVFDARTRIGVSQFQRWNKLTVTGTVNLATARRLELVGSASGGSSAPPSTTPDPAPAANPYVGLAVGARGQLVKDLQQALIGAGITVPGGADGVFGNATKTALTSYQNGKGLSATGSVDAATASALALGATTPTPAPATNQYVGLKVGDRGQLVKDLQQALITRGINVPGGADGVFGNATKTALTTYQTSNGLGGTGSVDAATATALGLGTTASPTPTPPASSNPYVGLTVGATGQRVKDLQQALMNLGLVVRGGADGVFGQATKSALMAFQSVNNIPQTGVLTEQGATILGLGTGSSPTTPSGAANGLGFPVFGETSERVRVMQVALANAGIVVPGGADGMYGSGTSGAIMDYQRREGLPVTGTMDAATAAKLGLSPAAAPAPPSSDGIRMQVFPVQGRCFFGDTWHAPRGGGRKHIGVDIIADEGKLLYAVVDGTITKQYWDYPGALAGNGLRLAQDDGTYFTYLHMLSPAPGIEVGAKVKAGQVIGYVGNTGSSATAHLHFEIHPRGGAAINPYPLVKAMDACHVTTPLPQVQSQPQGLVSSDGLAPAVRTTP